MRSVAKCVGGGNIVAVGIRRAFGDTMHPASKQTARGYDVVCRRFIYRRFICRWVVSSGAFIDGGIEVFIDAFIEVIIETIEAFIVTLIDILIDILIDCSSTPHLHRHARQMSTTVTP